MCEYCNTATRISGKKIMHTKINMIPIEIDILLKSLHVNLNGIGATSKINFCPMCSKALSNSESPTLEELIAANRILPEGFFLRTAIRR